MADYFWVKAAKLTDEGGRIVLWERDEAHPEGEVFIGDNKPVQVGNTSAVAERLRTGELVKVDAPAKAETETEADSGGESGEPKKPGRPKVNA